MHPHRAPSTPLPRAAFAIALASIGCGNTVETTDTDDPNGSVPCTVTPIDHADACPAPCPITVDVEVTCDDTGFGQPGIRVAPAPDTTWLVTASDDDRMLLRLDAAGGQRADDDLPPELARKTIPLALSPTGALQLFADLTRPKGEGEGFRHMQLTEDGWTQGDSLDFTSLSGFEVTAGGAPHFWGTLGPGSVGHAFPGATGAWVVEEASMPEDWHSVVFTLTNDGRPAALNVVDEDQQRQLVTYIDGVGQPLGAPGSDDLGFEYAVTHGPLAAASPSGPALAVVIRREDGLHVAWPEGETFEEVVLPGTAALSPTWEFAQSTSCDDTLHEVQEGVEPAAFAIARAGDGALWVAFSITKLDLVVGYDEDCTFGDCVCTPFVEQDDTTGELHLFRVPQDGAPPEEVLVLPTARIDVERSFGGQARAFDLRAFGGDLALGMLTTDDPYTQPRRPGRVRTLRIQTN